MASSASRIGRYELLTLIGTGGMAEIFLARQEGPSGFERPVVVKRVLPHLARQRVFREMFIDEARIVSRIHHPNVVAVHELGDVDDELFLVMEYLEGESLAGVMRRLGKKRIRLPATVAAHVAAEACGGLHAAHVLADPNGVGLGVVHRDVSPHNLFVLYSGHTKVIDFGIAKAIDRLGAKTETGQIKGKFAYMAPEQLKAEDVDARADVFAMGVVLHELLTGTRLFVRDNDLLVMRAVCEDPLLPPSATQPDVPPALDEIVMRALARDRNARYASAADMRRDLLGAVRRLGGADVPEEALAERLKADFGDRVARHAEVMRKFRTGQTITRVPNADGEDEPSAPKTHADASAGPSVVSASNPSTPPAPERRRFPVAFAFAAAIGVGVAISVAAFFGLSPSKSAATSPPGEAPSMSSTEAQPAASVAAAAPSPSIVTPTPSATASVEPTAASASVSSAPTTSAPLAAPVRPPSVSGPRPPPPGGFSRFD